MSDVHHCIDEGNDPFLLELNAAGVVIGFVAVSLDPLRAGDEHDDDGNDDREEEGAECAHGEEAHAAGVAVLGGAPGRAGVRGTLVFVDHGGELIDRFSPCFV